MVGRSATVLKSAVSIVNRCGHGMKLMQHYTSVYCQRTTKSVGLCIIRMLQPSRDDKSTIIRASCRFDEREQSYLQVGVNAKTLFFTTEKAVGAK